MNAILNKNSADVKHCTLYVALFPCNECAKLVIQSDLAEVVYFSDKYHDKPEMIASRRLLDMAKVKCRYICIVLIHTLNMCIVCILSIVVFNCCCSLCVHRQFVPQRKLVTIDFSSIDDGLYDVSPAADTSLLDSNSLPEK